jgi:hypothetical protein
MGSTEMKEGFNNKETGGNEGRGAMSEYDCSPSYEGQATGNYIKQKTTQNSSPISRSSILLYNNDTFNYEFRGRTNDDYYYYYYYYHYHYHYHYHYPVLSGTFKDANDLSQ